jgi:hypothetical protein
MCCKNNFTNFKFFSLLIINANILSNWCTFDKEKKPLFTYAFNFSDDDFIGASLGGMGYNHSLYKKKFQIANLLKVDSKSEFLKINILQVVMFQNVLMDPKILKEK